MTYAVKVIAKLLINDLVNLSEYGRNYKTLCCNIELQHSSLLEQTHPNNTT